VPFDAALARKRFSRWLKWSLRRARPEPLSFIDATDFVGLRAKKRELYT
jgi:hypothetical protein